MIEMMCKNENEVREVKKRFSDCDIVQKNNIRVFGNYVLTVTLPGDKKKRK